MHNNNLPLCPCGSGKFYEECCYKQKGVDGKPLFYKGAMTSKDSGKTWHPIPNSKFKVIIVGEAVDKYREYAKVLITKSKLSEKHYKAFINSYGLFYQSYEQLLKSLEETSGEGVAFQMDNIEARKHWKGFLFQGRILLDFIGLHSREILGLKRDIGGLNENKFNLILTTLEELGVKDIKYLIIKAELEPLRNNIVNFIGFRDAEKEPRDTIEEFPAIDSEFGLIKDGKLSLKGETFDMIKFIKESYESIQKMTLILLGIKH